MELKTTYKKIENVEKDGIELYFEAIPTKEERDALKAEGWRWHNQKRCWYKKNGEAPKAKKAEKFSNLTSLKLARTFEEFAQIWLKSHDYLLRYTDEKRQKTLEYFYKNYKLFTTSDGLIFEIETNQSIDSTLWYDDETEAPQNTFENFKLYNAKNVYLFRNLKRYMEERENLAKNGCASGCYDYNGPYFYKCNDFIVGVGYTEGNMSNKDKFIRYLTEEEAKDYYKIVEQIESDYNQRLERYWKRYKDHVCWSGYWVNR